MRDTRNKKNSKHTRQQEHAHKLAQANAELARKQYILDTFMEAVPDRIYFKDREGRITQANKAHALWVGRNDPTQEIGKTDFDFFPEEDAQDIYEQEQEIIKTGDPLLGIEEQQVRSDGRVDWLLTSRMPLRDERGEIIGTFGISRDITELKQAQGALAKAYAEILTLNDQLRKENLRYYMKALLLGAPFQTLSAESTTGVRKTWNAPYFCVVLVKLLPNFYSDDNLQPAEQQMMHSLMHYYEEYTQESSLFSIFSPISDTEAVLVLNTTEDAQIHALCTFLVSRSKAVLKENRYTLILGIGDVVTTPDALHTSYDIAQQTLLVRKNMAESQILSPKDVEQQGHESLLFYFPFEKEHKLISAVITGSYPQVTQLLQEIMNQNVLEQASYQKLVAVYDYCLRTAGKILAEAPIQSPDIIETSVLNTFKQKKPEIIQELRVRLFDFFHQLTECYCQRKKQHASALAEQLLRYLGDHYTDSNLSLDSIADAFSLHPNYLSRYFKDQIGINYVEYLAMLRINKAKELLVAHRRQKIYEIGRQVGFGNKDTFTTTFKKFEGVAPGIYRRRILFQQ